MEKKDDSRAYVLLELDAIRLSRTNPRTHIDKEALAELTDSVARHGVLQPVLVRDCGHHTGKGTVYELVAGYRRYCAAKAARLDKIPAVVRQLSDVEVLEVQLIENLQRSDLHPLEEAEGYRQLHEKHGYAVEDLAIKVGKSKAYVYGRLKFCDLPPAAKKAFSEGKVSASIALLVARIPDRKLGEQAMAEILGRGRYGYGETLSYREASRHVHERYMTALSGAPWKKDDAELLPEAGACTVCPKRTGNQRELFGDVGSADVCTDVSCFAKKLEAWKVRRIGQAQEAGQKVLTGKAAERALYGRDYVRLDDACHELHYDDKRFGKPWGQVLGKAAPESVLLEVGARGPNGNGNGLIEAVPRAAAQKALKEKYPDAAKKTAQVRSPSSGERDRLKKARWKMQVHDAAVTELVEKAEASKTDADLLRLLARGMVDRWWSETQKYVAHRRGIEKADSRLSLKKLVEELPEAELRGLLVELVAAPLGTYSWQEGWMNGLKIACSALGVELKKVEARLRREAASKKRPPHAAKAKVTR